MQPPPLILVVNDDGISAPGLRVLTDVVRPMGKVVVVAPDRPQSGTSHAVTVHQPLRLDRIHQEPDYEKYGCNGTPVDCVKLAFKVILGKRPDLLVSGINHGSNSSINIIYSGTMAAVFEGAMAGVPSIGFSLLNSQMDADFSAARSLVHGIIRGVMKNQLPEGVCLNVNIPHVPAKEIKGIRICRQAGGTWQEDFDVRKDPGGREYYWMRGVFARIGDGEDTDEWALENNYVSVVPVNFDFTDYPAMEVLRNWDFSLSSKP
ncbi:MAG: 5'/3'-nucleotidase SurE [bacterium]